MLESLVPYTCYQTVGVINGATGAVIAANVFGKVNYGSLNELLGQC
jgi:hypothetical protein